MPRAARHRPSSLGARSCGSTFTLAATLVSAAMTLLNRGPDGRMPSGWVAVTLVPVDSPDWPDTDLGRVVTRSIWSVLRRRR